MTNIARLTYNAAAELLSGSIGKAHFHEVAFSGGGRGHKSNVKHAAAARYLHGNPLNDMYGRLATTREVYQEKGDQYDQRGGTIPPGHYLCVYTPNHKTFRECVFLSPQADAFAIRSPFSMFPIPHHRSGFFIHGHGPKGSDGCIVLANESRRTLLNHTIRDFPGSVVLEVKHVSYMLPAERGISGDERLV